MENYLLKSDEGVRAILHKQLGKFGCLSVNSKTCAMNVKMKVRREYECMCDRLMET